MNNCPVCNGSAFSEYPYGNHLGKTNRTYVKHVAATILAPWIRLFNRHYYEWVKLNLLFSPFSLIMRCNICGHGKYEREIDPGLLAKYYGHIYWQAGGIDPDCWHQERLFLEDDRANGQYTFVQPWLARLNDPAILEIGAGSAFFSRLLREKHPGTPHISVVEPGYGWEPYYRDLSIRLAAKYFPFESRSAYDYVHASHWLEHIVDVPDALNGIAKLLTEKGYLFIEVPNCNDEYYSLDIGDVPHVQFFTKRSLCTLLEKSGFVTVAADEYGYTCSEGQKLRETPADIGRQKYREGRESIAENHPRKGGHTLRALFQLPGVKK